MWKRFSELKKLHGELAYTHRNLFRREEGFPPFPPAQLFGRFEESVIEERRKATEVMLLFTTNIPALYNSPQLKDFFRGGEMIRPLDPSPLSSSSPLPPPLIPLPQRRASDCEPVEEEEGREAPVLPQDLGLGLGPDLGEPEVATEAYGEMGGSPQPESPTEEEEEEDEGQLSDEELANRVNSPGPSPMSDHQEEFDLLFDHVTEEEVPPPDEEVPPPLSETDLAIFDPCFKEETSPPSPTKHSDLLALPLTNPSGGEAGYLSQAASEVEAAMELEKEEEFSSAIRRYKSAVDILITGVKDDQDPHRRECVKRRTAQYLKHAETLLSSLSSPTHTQGHNP